MTVKTWVIPKTGCNLCTITVVFKIHVDYLIIEYCLVCDTVIYIMLYMSYCLAFYITFLNMSEYKYRSTTLGAYLRSIEEWLTVNQQICACC